MCLNIISSIGKDEFIEKKALGSKAQLRCNIVILLGSWKINKNNKQEK